MASFSRARWIFAKMSAPLVNRGILSYGQNKFPEAAAGYERLIVTGSVSPALYFNLGNANFKSGQIGRAIAAAFRRGALPGRISAVCDARPEMAEKLAASLRPVPRS